MTPSDLQRALELAREWQAWSAWAERVTPATVSSEPPAPLEGDSTKLADAFARALIALAAERDAMATQLATAKVIIEAIPGEHDLDRAASRKVYREQVSSLFTADDEGYSALYLPDAAERWLAALDAQGKDRP
jgi:hypothetical protein